MSASLFENKPQRCPFGHQLWPGKAQVSWKPCICEPAREAAARGRGMGHVRVACNSCHDQLRETVFFEPVPLEYSIEWLTCAVASRLDAVMVG